MEAQSLINVLFSVTGVLIGWVVHSIKDSVKDLQVADASLAQKVQEIEVLVVGDYVRHSDFKEFSTAIFAKLDRMEGKIDGKADKTR
jgi:hypothetical protein